MKSKSLCIVAIDTSGSMLQNHGATKFSKIEVLNEILRKFVERIKINKTLNDKLEVAIVEIKEQVRLVVAPIGIKEVVPPIFETIPETEESIGLGISFSLNIIKKWKRGNYFSELLKQNYTPYLILVTDLDQEHLLDEERQYPFKNRIEKLANDNYLKFFGIGVGNAQLVSFFDSSVANLHVTNNPDFESFFRDIEEELSKEIREDKPLKEEIMLLDKYYKVLAPFFRKHYKKMGIIVFILSLIKISFTVIEANGIKIEIEKLIEVNYTEINNYENNYPGNEININIDKETNWVSGESDVKFTYEFKDVIDDYNLGAYLHNSSEAVGRSSRILLINLLDLQRKFQVNGGVYIKVTGETDAVPVLDLTYKGEFGQLVDKVFQENGRWYKMSFKNTEKIKSNHELAFLRGYSIWDLMRRNFDLIINCPTQYQQIIKVNDDTNRIGGKHRRVMIEMILFNVEKKDQSEIQRFLD